LAELPDIPVSKEEEPARDFPDLPDLMPDELPQKKEEDGEKPKEREAERARPRPQPFRVPEKQKPRWRSITFLSILLAAILIGAFLWLTRSSGEPERAAEPRPAHPAARRQAPPRAHPVEPKSEAQPAAGAEAKPAEQAQPEAASGSHEAPAAAQSPGGQASPPVRGSATPAEKIVPAKRVAEAAGAGPARQHFNDGDFRAAADAWRAEIIAAQTKFSILLEMDCLKDSVRIAYRQLEDKGGFFLLNKRSRDGRGCWLVLWGRYRTADEAALGLKLLPQYFWKQSEPPSVIELDPYL
jgi:hypothetical protein